MYETPIDVIAGCTCESCQTSAQEAAPEAAPELAPYGATIDSLAAQIVEMRTAHAAEVAQRDRAILALQGKFDGIVANAHEWADEHGMCSVFDEFCEDNGLESRNRDFDVTVDVSFSVIVSGNGRSYDEAAENIDSYAVSEAVEAYARTNRYYLDFEVSQEG